MLATCLCCAVLLLYFPDLFKVYFEQYGKVLEAQIMVDHTSGRSRGFGWVPDCPRGAGCAMRACWSAQRPRFHACAAVLADSPLGGTGTGRGVFEQQYGAGSWKPRHAGLRIWGCRDAGRRVAGG